jgi:hypothetical protein
MPRYGRRGPQQPPCPEALTKKMDIPKQNLPDNGSRWLLANLLTGSGGDQGSSEGVAIRLFED